MKCRLESMKLKTGKQLKQLKAVAASALLGTAMLCTNVVPAVILGASAAFFCSETVWAMEAGSYLVTVTPSYTDPATGKIEDPGNNEAIGQGMTQKLCGSQGLLEVDASGNMYLTVRYYLSQFVSDVSFEERSGGSYSTCSYQKMQVKEPVEGASNIDDKYGYTDYRIPIQSLDSVFRGKAYIEPMGRSVVYFFQASGPEAGSGDFVTSIQTELPAQMEAQAEAQMEAQAEALTEALETESERKEELIAANEGLETDWRSEEELREPEGEREDVASGKEIENYSGAGNDEDSTINGSGNADDPVTGIPVKPGTANGGRTADEITSNPVNEEYHLETVYDLSAVPIKEARKLTEPMLEEATGITITVGSLPKSSESGEAVVKDSLKDTNKSVMLVLLGVAAILMIRFTTAVLMTHRGTGERQKVNENHFEQDEIEKRGNQE